MQTNTSIAPASAGDENRARSATSDRASGMTHGLRFADRSQHALAGVRGMGRIAAMFSAALLLAFGAAGVGAQNAAQDAIDRGLLLRQQQE